MLIDDIDFAEIYRQQLALAHRTEKTPDHWDKRAEKRAENCASPQDRYLQHTGGYSGGRSDDPHARYWWAVGKYLLFSSAGRLRQWDYCGAADAHITRAERDSFGE